jgi:hypothetical protein
MRGEVHSGASAPVYLLLTGADKWRKSVVGERGFEPPAPASRRRFPSLSCDSKWVFPFGGACGQSVNSATHFRERGSKRTSAPVYLEG